MMMPSPRKAENSFLNSDILNSARIIYCEPPKPLESTPKRSWPSNLSILVFSYSVIAL